jgi:type I restriction enzyme S subunit
MRLKALVSNPTDKVNDPDLAYVALEHLESGTGRLLPGVELESKDADDSVAHEAGDVRFGKLRPYLAKSFLADAAGVGSGELLVLRPGPRLLSRYLWYITLCRPFVDWAVATSYGVKMPRTSWDALGAFELDLPPLDEQRRIVDLLDIETARVDELIAEQHRLDQLSRERWEGVLSSMVLGMDGSRRVPTGHPWWESLPSDWQVRELRFACGGVTVGVVVNPSTYVDESGDVPFIRGTDVRPFVINADGAQRMTSASNSLLSKSKLVEGDIVVVRVGAPGTAAVVSPELDGANCASVLIVRRTESTDPKFLCAVLNSRVGRDQVRCMSNGAAQEQVNAGDIVAMAVPFPDLPTQRMIGQVLEAERHRLLGLQSELTHQVDLLREHRQALITAAVMGGLDAVRKVA